MQVSIKTVDQVLVIEIDGDMDLIVAEKLKDQVAKLMGQHQCKHLIFNLKKVAFIDSSGLGLILGRYKYVTEKGGQVLIVEPQPQVKRILEMSGLEKIMGIYENETEAFAEMA
ncbi:stage II sporulation protein AA (anti-sigma F factor antagonist) [Desulfitispora alkaliphila]|uniref:anti-sigma F factor antagonist n=1 Tax=Desulfitispora alkaliphila TaxID=622674 RepID=UPI003D22650E